MQSSLPQLSPQTDRPTVVLKPNGHKRVLAGHPWIYSNEVAMEPAVKALAPGSLVRIVSHERRPLGTAIFNPQPLISARMLSRDANAVIDRRFFAARLNQALALRERLFDAPFYRLVHAEADGLPGTILDRFGAVIVMQVNTAGMERLLPELLAALDEVLAPEVVLLRNDSAARTLEGIDSYCRLAKGTLEGPIELIENGVRFLADPREGQKTGWFFDQRANRAFVARLAKDVRVLDVYSYTGGFALQAASAGATEVLAIDRSQGALDLAAQAAALNSVAERCRFRRGDAFEELQRLAAAGERFDIVVADPPAFVKSRKDLNQGARAYRKLARLAAGLVRRGGFLFIASCSHNMEPALFAEQARRGLVDAGRGGRILFSTGADADHPVHPALPESAYLKAQLLQVD
ncbi:class I SAM-dependent rRNA methyltransferase [Rhodospirillaceae bacterium SYSU D60014]|uniref:class I SAM-dependent rRNA methyltransferase n=1 Tax=Virgifigura deserti TaxID=2268457 RepID=UPI000E669892